MHLSHLFLLLDLAGREQHFVDTLQAGEPVAPFLEGQPLVLIRSRILVEDLLHQHVQSVVNQRLLGPHDGLLERLYVAVLELDFDHGEDGAADVDLHVFFRYAGHVVGHVPSIGFIQVDPRLTHFVFLKRVELTLIIEHLIAHRSLTPGVLVYRSFTLVVLQLLFDTLKKTWTYTFPKY